MYAYFWQQRLPAKSELCECQATASAFFSPSSKRHTNSPTDALYFTETFLRRHLHVCDLAGRYIHPRAALGYESVHAFFKRMGIVVALFSSYLRWGEVRCGATINTDIEIETHIPHILQVFLWLLQGGQRPVRGESPGSKIKRATGQ